MKRFWDKAETVAEEAAWAVKLDGKTLRVPGGGPLSLPNQALAEAIAAEWQAAGGGKGGEMSYADLPLTRLAGTAQERVAPAMEPVILELSRYAQTDLLCYRAEHPRTLVEQQALLWQPWLNWAEATYGARLEVTSGIMHVAQPTASLAALAQAVAALQAHPLAALGVLVPSYGSLVLGLAVAAGALAAGEAHELATLDERHQAAQWGWDEEAQARLVKVAEDVAIAGRFLALCMPGRL
jgi:chaperone required for assembly of F1-ATPase